MSAHTFVVRGDLAKIAADLYVLPTDQFGSLSAHWSEFLGSFQLNRESAKPLATDLERDGYAVLHDQVIGFNSGGGYRIDDANAFLGRVEHLLTYLQQKCSDHTGNRPLVAMPLLGLGRAGHRHEAGLILKDLLKLIERPKNRSFDLVLVAFNEADYSALQYLRSQETSQFNLSPSLAAVGNRLTDHAQHGTLAVMFGAGASIDLKIPLWKELLERLGGELNMDDAVVQQLGDLDPVDAASLLIDKAGGAIEFNKLLKVAMHTTKATLMHSLLANLHPSIAITTNYDVGYEIAIEAISGRPAAVMPWERPTDRNQPRILKLHGDADRGSIVLSRDEFAAMQAYRKPLVGTLQERMLVGHVLVVGSSMSDSTMVHAAEEVATLSRMLGVQSGEKSGTVILNSSNPAREQLLKRVFEVHVADSGESEDHAKSSRQVHILLDYVGMRAADKSKFLLDDRYDDLLAGAELEAAKFGRELKRRLEQFAEENPQASQTTAFQHLGLLMETQQEKA